jgi:hypothetical protein
MKYKGFVIQPVYSICADWSLNKHGQVVSRKPKSSDIECYEVIDPMENDRRFFAESTIAECKSEIDRMLKEWKMKDNTKESWNLLDKQAWA